MDHSSVALTVALALAVGIVIQALARTIRVPAIILLLGAGVLLGPVGLGWVRPGELGGGLFVIVDFAVAVILFEGALNLDIGRLRRQERVIRNLLTWGALVTLVGGALAARTWLGWPWTLAVLFGALVVVTGPTVVGPLIRGMRLNPRMQTVLEAEGVLIDPIGALLAVLVLQVILAADALGVAAQARDLGLRLVIGIAFGAAGGLAIAGLLRLQAIVRGLENVLTLALVILLFHLGEHVMSQSGLLAVTVAGLVVGNLKSPVDEDLREFKDQLTVLLIGAIFILLAADTGIEQVRALGWPGVAVVATLILVVRPAGVLLATRGTTLSARERVFVGIVAPRGIVAAAVSSLIASSLTLEGIDGGDALRALVFLVIAGTVIAAGVLSWPLAIVLGLRLPARDRVAILGAQGLGFALGRVLQQAKVPVVFVEADPQRCRAAETLGFHVVYGDGLSERTLRRLPIDLVGTAVGATFNDHLNSQFAQLAQHTFGVPEGLVLVDSIDGEQAPEHVRRHGADVLFEGPHDQERWDVRWRQDDVEIVRFVRQRPDVAQDVDAEDDDRRALAARDAVAWLALERNGKVYPMWMSYTPKADDAIHVAVVTSLKDRALPQLASLGWVPAAG